MSEHPAINLARTRLFSEYWYQKMPGNQPPKELIIKSSDLEVYSMWFEVEGFIYETDFWVSGDKLTYRLQEQK